MEKSQKQKMLAGELYHAGDPEIQRDQAAAKTWMVRYNAPLAASASGTANLTSRVIRACTHKAGDGASGQMSALLSKADISRTGRHVR
jgi:maltose O-acetyltransferase